MENERTHPSDPSGRTVIVDYTLQLPVHPERPEPAFVQPRKLSRRDILKKLPLSEAQFDLMLGIGEGPFKFPVAQKKPHRTGWGWDLVWSESEIDSWIERIRPYVPVFVAIVG